MSSPRMEQVFYHTHSKVSHYFLRHTTHRQRSALEHAALGLAVCGFCIVILSHRTFVHREDIASIARTTTSSSRLLVHSGNNEIMDEFVQDGIIGSCDAMQGGDSVTTTSACETTAEAEATEVSTTGSGHYFFLGLIGEGRGVSMYSIMIQLTQYALTRYQRYKWKNNASHGSSASSSASSTLFSTSCYWTGMKKIPTSCLKSIPGFREDADVNHILLQLGNGRSSHDTLADDGTDDDEQRLSRAFTIHRGWGEKNHLQDNQIVTGRFSSTSTTRRSNNSTRYQAHSCVIGHSSTQQQEIINRRRMPLLGRIAARDQTTPPHDNDDEMCSEEVSSFLAQYGYLSTKFYDSPHLEDPSRQSNRIDEQQQEHQSLPTLPKSNLHHYSPIIYSYSHSQGLLRLQPSLQHKHNISTQFIIASASDPLCFGEPFTQNIIFHWVGYDTVVLNWILGLQHLPPRPRFVYHWKTRKELDLNVYDMDHYAFSSKKAGEDGENMAGRGAYERMQFRSPSSSSLPSALQQLESIIIQVQKYPLYRLLRFLAFKLWILFSTLLIFFLTTSLVSFTFQETQDRMLEFTLQLQTRVRNGMPLGGLILDHVLENLVFVPIMVGMIFFLIEFYGGDKFLAFSVLSMVWICEVFSAISIRSAQGMHFFPRVFFLYFTLFHVYFFSCPVGFTYASLASTTLFLVHTAIFFWNRYELPALHAGLITPQIPRMSRLGMDRVRADGEVNGMIPSPPRLQSFSQLMVNTQHVELPPPIPNVSSADDRSPFTAVTAPLSSTFDVTPHSDQQSMFPPTYPGPMRSYVAAASTSLQSIRSFASIQSLVSNAAGRDSPNLIFQGGYGFNDSGSVGEDSEDDSYIARVMSS